MEKLLQERAKRMDDPYDIHLTRQQAVTLIQSLRFLQRLDSQGGDFAFIGEQQDDVVEIIRKLEKG